MTRGCSGGITLRARLWPSVPGVFREGVGVGQGLEARRGFTRLKGRRTPGCWDSLGRGPTWDGARCPQGGAEERGFPGSAGKKRLEEGRVGPGQDGRRAAGGRLWEEARGSEVSERRCDVLSATNGHCFELTRHGDRLAVIGGGAGAGRGRTTLPFKEMEPR